MGVSAPDQRIVELLDSWEGAQVSVRITTGLSDRLIAVFSGCLKARSGEKHPALFWPVEQPHPPQAERPASTCTQTHSTQAASTREALWSSSVTGP
jgi:hypothetical protein